jgi:hypothetical protein
MVDLGIEKNHVPSDWFHDKSTFKEDMRHKKTCRLKGRQVGGKVKDLEPVTT